MRFANEDGDFEHRCNRLTGSLDAIRDLLGGQAPDLSIHAPSLPYLIELVCVEAHAILDPEEGDEEQPRKGPLRAVD